MTYATVNEWKSYRTEGQESQSQGLGLTISGTKRELAAVKVGELL